VHSKFYSLRLAAGRNIIINTSASPDQAHTQIEAATMGYRFAPSAKPTNKNFPTYSLQEAGPREGLAAQAKPSICHVAQRHLQGMSGRPTSLSTPLAPKTIAQLESKTATERAAREHRGELNVGSMGFSATPQLDPRTVQRLSEEYGGDLDTALMVTDTLRPEGPLQMRGETMPGDGLVRVDDIYGAYPEVKATKDPVLGHNGRKRIYTLQRI